MMRSAHSAPRQSGRAIVAALVALLVVGVVAVLLLNRDVVAQPPGQPGAVMPPRMPMMSFASGGGSVAMVVHRNYLYVAQGGTLYKIDPETMTVEGEVQFVKPRPMPMGPAGPPGPRGPIGPAGPPAPPDRPE